MIYRNVYVDNPKWRNTYFRKGDLTIQELHDDKNIIVWKCIQGHKDPHHTEWRLLFKSRTDSLEIFCLLELEKEQNKVKNNV